jgi:predicted NUDIX family NTP pyrophosphohydrolase
MAKAGKRTKPAAGPARARSRAESAGLLLFRRGSGTLECFLAHPGGPFWKNRDAGAWTIPKGLVEEGEDLLAAACREFSEETGLAPQPPLLPLGSVRQKAGKLIHAWAFEGDADPSQVRSNLIPVPVGNSWRQFPEIDRCEWFSASEARLKLNPAQAEWLDRLEALLAARP